MTDEPNVTPVSPEDTARLLEMGEAVRGVVERPKAAHYVIRGGPTGIGVSIIRDGVPVTNARAIRLDAAASDIVTVMITEIATVDIEVDAETRTDRTSFAEYSPTPETWTA